VSFRAVLGLALSAAAVLAPAAQAGEVSQICAQAYGTVVPAPGSRHCVGTHPNPNCFSVETYDGYGAVLAGVEVCGVA
jgi:LDH2 family malate/lactate/ureidoglycolate dehydrogenase